MFRSKFATMSAIAGAALFCASTAQAITFTIPNDAPLIDGVWSVLDVRNNGGIGNQDQARTSLQGVGGTRVTTTIDKINYLGSGGTGRFGNDNPFPQGDGDNIAMLMRAKVYAPVSGFYTINVNSDDGFTLAVNGGASSFSTVYGGGTILDTYNGNANGAVTFFGGRGVADSGASVFLNEGSHVLDLTYHEGGGGSAVEVSAAFGQHAGFQGAGFTLIDGNKNAIKNVIPGVVGDIFHAAANGLPAQNINSAKAHIANATFFSTSSVINHRDPDNGTCCGGINNGQMIPFANNAPGINDDNFATQFTGVLDMPEAGAVLFHIQSDDGFSFQVDGGEWTLINSANFGATSVQNNGEELVANFGTGNSNVVAILALGEGQHNFALTHWDGGGGSYIQVFVGGLGTAGGVLLGSVDGQVIGQFNRLSLNPVIPEPASALLGLMGLAAIGMRRRRQQA